MTSNLSSFKSWPQLAKHLEYANLQSNAREADIRLLCLEAEKWGIEVVVVNPVNVALAVSVTKGTKVKVAAAISYPVGGDLADHKEKEVAEAVEDGADVIYMLMAVGAFRDNWFEQQTLPEIRGMVKAAAGRPTRLITEASVLTGEQRKKICQMAIQEKVPVLMAATAFERSHLPELTDKDIQELVSYAGNSLEIMVMDTLGTMNGIRHYFSLGVKRICSEHVRALWKEMNRKETL
jgi:deoxyribose-phosphate aldolase